VRRDGTKGGIHKEEYSQFVRGNGFFAPVLPVPASRPFHFGKGTRPIKTWHAPRIAVPLRPRTQARMMFPAFGRSDWGRHYMARADEEAVGGGFIGPQQQKSVADIIARGQRPEPEMVITDRATSRRPEPEMVITDRSEDESFIDKFKDTLSDYLPLPARRRRKIQAEEIDVESHDPNDGSTISETGRIWEQEQDASTEEELAFEDYQLTDESAAEIEKRDRDMAKLEKKNAKLEKEVETFKEELGKMKDGQTQAEAIVEAVISLPEAIEKNIEIIKETLDEKLGIGGGTEDEIEDLKDLIEEGQLQVEEDKENRQLVKVESLRNLLWRIVAEVKRRAAFRLETAVHRYNDLTLPMGSLRAAYARSLLICSATLGIQVIGPAAYMPETLYVLFAKWEGWRAAHVVASAMPSMFVTYAATDMLLQTIEFHEEHKGTTAAERAGVNISVARSIRTGLVSGFVVGFVNIYFYRWLKTVPFPFPGFLEGRVGLAAQICAVLPLLYRITIDLTFWNPLMTTMYLTLQALLRGRPKQIIPEIKAKVLTIWRMSPRYWLFADLIIFSVVSARLRLVVTALFNIPWSMYLDRMANMPDFDSHDDDARRDYAQMIINNLEAAVDPDSEDGEGEVDDDQFKQFWNQNKQLNGELAKMAGAERERSWLAEIINLKRQKVEKLKERQQAALVVKLLADLQTQVPSSAVSEMRVVLADVKAAEKKMQKEANMEDKEQAMQEALVKENDDYKQRNEEQEAGIDADMEEYEAERKDADWKTFEADRMKRAERKDADRAKRAGTKDSLEDWNYSPRKA